MLNVVDLCGFGVLNLVAHQCVSGSIALYYSLAGHISHG